MNIDAVENNKNETKEVVAKTTNELDLSVENKNMVATEESESVTSSNIQDTINRNFFSSVQDVISVLSPNVSSQKSANKKNKSHPSKSYSNEKSAEDKILEANDKAKNALLDVYIREEGLRQKRQKPIMIAIILLLSVQLIFFNVLIFILVLNGAKTINAEIFETLLEFLKYYIGAVVVELIGLIITITTNTFSSHLSKNITNVLFQ